jgi:hypothetical protein
VTTFKKTMVLSSVVDDFIGKLNEVLPHGRLSFVHFENTTQRSKLCVPMKMPFLSNTRMKFLKELILYRDCFTMQETTQKCDVNKHSVKDRLGLVNVNSATVVKVVTNLIV